MLAEWICTSCLCCGWKADRTTPPSIKTVIERYGEVAKSVNQREFKRFIEELRQKWNPPPPAEEEWEDGYRGEGWTDEGAFALCFYQQATSDSTPPRQGPLCEAEEQNQVLLRPVDSLIDDIRPGPLVNPLPEETIVEALASLREAIQRRVNENSPSEDISVELPTDFEQLLRITNYIGGAGVNSETANTYLVGGIDSLAATGSMNKWEKWFPWTAVLNRRDFKPFAAWQLGGCNQHRQIYYVLGRDLNDNTAPITWKVFDRNDVEMELFENLTEFLHHETQHIEQTPGGHKQEHILFSDAYPTW
ncbi:uncharacterized protein RCC_12264 [Ramularia collo-cygni]|uniref:Uncharacterized protein n=1 Tax=Ramularia collo-cygni TaxID=112498 RepID=A0A2D3UNF0_9PEZI|nr:uncharacterized protein RCC_12264 [Ramularia collo-cygni]CZT14918.1 uncharacterized protein RCC_12264 [Ramularia collo-cygni]